MVARAPATLVLCTVMCLVAGAYCKVPTPRSHQTAARRLLAQDAGCHDLLNECAAWADLGLCEAGFSWHDKPVGSFLCKQSCDSCGSEQGTSQDADDDDSAQQQESDDEEAQGAQEQEEVEEEEGGSSRATSSRAAAATTRAAGGALKFIGQLALDAITSIGAEVIKSNIPAAMTPEHAFAKRLVEWSVAHYPGYNVVVTFSDLDQMTPVNPALGIFHQKWMFLYGNQQIPFNMYWVQAGARATFTKVSTAPGWNSCGPTRRCQVAIQNVLQFY